ncbi:MAG: aldehyde dehydrogenase family protein [Kiritimatiellia bacterium]|jgi:aldehyde dehydrogenase (NAD+)|nr:aldehyde dehydrogenase family protein [Kiritimatiellia bacterium]
MSEVLLNYIKGVCREGAGADTFANENPSKRGSELNRAQASTEADVEAAITVASAAFKTWSRTPVAHRQAIVESFLGALAAGRDELAQIVSMENGKTIRESRGEVDSALLEGRHHLRQVTVFAGESAPDPDGDVTAWEQYHPLGVVGVISPWNYPMNVMCRKTLPALLTGNTVVFKPASYTPWSAAFMAGLFDEAGVPAGVFNCVFGRGSSIGNRLIGDPRVRAISFTGSTEVGRRIQSMAAAGFTRTQLELGGKNALIVLADADMDAAIEATIKAGFGCAGQWCTSTSRVLLVPEIAEAYTEKLLARCAAMQVGDPLDEATDMGPVAGASQFNAIAASIEKAVSEGANLRCGGISDNDGGYYVLPTVFDGVTREMSIFREEIFGPVLALSTVKDLDEALQWANDCDYGLSSAIFTRDMPAALRYVREIEAGMAHVNIHSGFKTPELPFGGWKDSGFGPPENGLTGLEFFLERKAVYIGAT